MLKSGLSVGFLLTLAGSANTADLQDFFRHSIVNDRYTFSSGIGYSWINADEFAYAEGERISQLFWASQTPVVSAELGFNPIHNFTVHTRAKIGFAGDSRMDDYDWENEYSRSYQFDDWTAHSSHEDTNLDRYISADVAVGYDFHINNVHTLNLNGGFKYSNIKWTAYGGEFTYSIFDFRDITAKFPDNARSITYEQRIPALFLGAQWSAELGRLSFSALARLGTTVNAKTIDHHWQRPILFEDRLDKAPYGEIGATASYRVSNQVQLFAAGSYEKHWKMTGDSYATEMETGEQAFDPGGTGGALRSFTLSGGLKVSF